jgi:hypothetical protein
MKRYKQLVLGRTGATREVVRTTEQGFGRPAGQIPGVAPVRPGTPCSAAFGPIARVQSLAFTDDKLLQVAEHSTEPYPELWMSREVMVRFGLLTVQYAKWLWS